MADRKKRLEIIIYAILLLSCVLIGKLYYLQIVYNQKYKLYSNRNSIRTTRLVPKRGRIFTADNRIIAWNVHRYKLIMERCKRKDFDKNLQLISQYISLSPQDLENINNSRQRHYSVIKDALSWEEYSNIAMAFFKFNNLVIDSVYSREYFLPEEFCHICGYVTGNNNSLQVLEGKSGVELYFNEYLTGKLGNVMSEVNAAGKKIRTLETEPPTDGKDLRLTINSELQKYVHEIMSQEKAGACVVLDMDGKILAMVSVPTFDTNILSGRMNKSQWDAIIKNPQFPLLNRVIGCAYPPGSIFKIVIGYAALCEGVVTPKDRIFCSGGYLQDGHTFHCWNRSGHGWVNMVEALSYSCDCYFFEVAKRLGIDRIAKYAKLFGYGSPTGIEICGEISGLMPSREWKILRHGSLWKPYETLIVGIGQGAVLATLAQTATMLGRLYSENYGFTPHLVQDECMQEFIKESESMEENPAEKIQAQKFDVAQKLNPTAAQVIKEGLQRVCTSGTAARSCAAPYGIAGKTGSSQVRRLKKSHVGIKQDKLEWKYRDHAFFAGVAPNPNPRYIVAVFVEHGGGGASVAAPIARKVFDKLMELSKNEN